MVFNELLIGAICTGAGVLISKGTDAVISLRKARSEATVSELEKATAVYREITTSLRHDIETLLQKIEALEADRLSCREENAAMRAEIKVLRTEMDLLKVGLTPIKQTT